MTQREGFTLVCIIKLPKFYSFRFPDSRKLLSEHIMPIVYTESTRNRG
jgi:hypothetical protein